MTLVSTSVSCPTFVTPTPSHLALRAHQHPHRRRAPTRSHFSTRGTSRALLGTTPHHTNSGNMALPNLKLKAIFFDLDGTDHIHYETYRDTLLELVPDFNDGQPITRAFYDTHMSGRQNPQLVASILPNLPLAERTRLWQTKEQRYEAVISRGVPPVRGLPQLLRSCKEYNLQSYIVTNAPRGSAAKTLACIGIAGHFGDRVVVGEDCEFPKPHPAPYIRALKLAAVGAEEAIAVEDSPSGIRSATAAGLVTIGVRSTQSDEVLREAGAIFTVADFTAETLAEALAFWL